MDVTSVKSDFVTVRVVVLPAKDTHFADAIQSGPMAYGRGTYQLKKIQPAVAFVKNKGTALDIGAHVGLWSMILSRQFEEVHAFEPVPIHLACFKANLYDRRNVHVHPVALGSQNGIVSLNIEEANSGNTHVTPMGTKSADPFAVNVHRLDVLVSEMGINKAQFIKIDVEGYELEVVKGAEKYIRDCKPVMVVEQKRSYSNRYASYDGQVIELLKAWGAQVMWTMNGDYCLKWRD